jgi:hypothetical protein
MCGVLLCGGVDKFFFSCGFFRVKVKTGSTRTARRHTFARQQKYAKVPGLLAEGNSFARFHSFPFRVVIEKSAHTGGPCCDGFDRLTIVKTLSAFAFDSDLHPLSPSGPRAAGKALGSLSFACAFNLDKHALSIQRK